MQNSSPTTPLLSSLSAEELLKWGLANLWVEGTEVSYAIWHRSQPVNDLGDQSEEKLQFLIN